MKHHAYIVTWIDSAVSHGWHPIECDGRASTITTVGWLAKQDKNTVTITSSISDHGRVVDPLTIPRVAVQRMYRLPQHIKGK